MIYLTNLFTFTFNCCKIIVGENMLIDVHSHINDERLINKVKTIIKDANDNSVEKIVCVGDNFQSSKKCLELSNKYKNIYSVLGVHPSNADDFTPETENFIRQNANNKKVIGIGEIGLDYHSKTPNKEKQKEVFIKQLKLAHELKLPIEIHTRDAIKDTIDILTEYKNLLSNSGIIHCYSGSYETLLQIQKLGLKISIGGILTFKNARQTLEVFKKAPLNMIMLETDCPYLTPTPFRGQINEPKYLIYVAKKLAEIKNLPLNLVEDTTCQNTINVFKKLSNV